MDIAICFEKVSLGVDMFLFKPINVIRGSYRSDSGIFISDYGYVYSDMNGDDCNQRYYFGHLTNLKELEDTYGKRAEQELLYEYLSISTENYYLACYDEDNSEFKVKMVPIADVSGNDDKTFSVKDENSTLVVLDIEALENLRKVSDIETVHKDLDDILAKVNALQEGLKEEIPELNNGLATQSFAESEMGMSLKNLRREVLKRVIAQDRAVYDITREIYMNLTSNNPRNKSHILVTGPSGTGKTEIVSTIAQLLKIPYFAADATAYTKEGYVGKSVYSMLLGLIDAANGDVELAQNGILIIDEIDKKLSTSGDVAGLDVMYSLLKIMDRGIVELDSGRAGERRIINFDTSNLTIILMGAFEDIYKDKMSVKKQEIGFNSKSAESVDKKRLVLSKEDLIKGGFPVQALGRIGDITSTNFFTVEDLEHILTESEISALLILKQYFKESLGVDLQYTSEYVKAIATKAVNLGTNARELKSLVKESIKIAFDEIEDSNAKVLKLTKETALDNTKYTIE